MDGPNIEIIGLLQLQAIGLRLQVIVVLDHRNIPAADLCFEYWMKGVHEKYPTSSSQTIPDEDF
jgi:hypothetical protein